MKPGSGKFIVRVAPALHARLQSISQQRHISLNRLCVEQFEALAGNDSNEVSPMRFGIPVSELRRRLIESGFQIQGCVIFGSAVRGEMTDKSDLDLLLVLDAEQTLTRDLYDRWDQKVRPFLKETVACEVSPQFVVLPSRPELAGGLWYEVAIQGVVLFEKADSVSRALIRMREWIASGKAQRKVSHGHPYWLKT